MTFMTHISINVGAKESQSSSARTCLGFGPYPDTSWEHMRGLYYEGLSGMIITTTVSGKLLSEKRLVGSIILPSVGGN